MATSAVNNMGKNRFKTDSMSRVGEVIVPNNSNRKPDKIVIEYVMTAIIEFARHHAISIKEASNYLNQYKGISFLTEFYDVEHTLSFNDCVSDLTIVCMNNGGSLR